MKNKRKEKKITNTLILLAVALTFIILNINIINSQYTNYGNPNSYSGSNYNYGSNYESSSSTYSVSTFQSTSPGVTYSNYPYTSSGYGRYYQSFPSKTYLQSQNIDLYRTFDNKQCSLGQDFLVQVAPFGCSPSVVRSDLLEEQNVPVFCQLAATKLNPLIDIDAIYSMQFTALEGYPPGVVTVGFHPAKSALKQNLYSSISGSSGFSGRTGSLLNSPILNNIGYAVIVLKQQPNEKSMPKVISGNLTAIFRYDVKNAFGVGNIEFVLPEMDDSKWNEEYKSYSFWKGRGFLKAELVNPNEAVVSIMSDKNIKVDTINLAVGETPKEVRLPGFYCLAKANIQLSKVDVPDTTARLRIDDDYIDLVANQRFLDDRCTVQVVEKNGLFEFVQIKCNEDNGVRYYDFFKSPRIILSINGEQAAYKIGEPLKINLNEGKEVNRKYYIRIVEKNPKTGKLSAVLGSSLSANAPSSYNYRQYPSTLSSSNSYIYDNKMRVDLGDTLTLPKIGTNSKEIKVEFIGLSEGVNEDFSQYSDNSEIANLNSEFKKYYDEAIEDYNTVANDFTYEKTNPEFGESSETYGKVALKSASDLASRTGQIISSKEFLEKIKDQYETIDNKNEINLMINDSLFYSEEETRGVMINGKLRIITFLGSKKPGLDEFSVNFYVRNEETKTINNGNSDPYILGKDDRIELSENGNDQIILKYLDENSAYFDYIGEDFVGTDNNNLRKVTRRIKIEKSRPLTIGNKYTFSIDNIKLKKVAYVRIIPELEDIRTQANFSFNIGIEKRAIELSPKQTEKRIEKTNKTLETLNKISSSLGKVVKTTKAACLATSGFLITKNFLQNLGGKQIARQAIMRSEGGWTEYCRQALAEELYSSLDDCFRKNADAIDSDVETLNSFMQKQNEEIKSAKGTSGGSIFGNDYYNHNKYIKNYLPNVKEDLSSCGENGNILNPDDTNKKISVNDLNTALTKENEEKGGFYIEQARDIQLYCRLLGSGESSGTRLEAMAKRKLYNTAYTVSETTKDLVAADSLQKNFQDSGFNNININSYGKKNSVKGIYSGGTIKGDKIQGVDSKDLDASKTYSFEPFYYGNEKYVAILDGVGGNDYSIKDVYKLDSVENGNIKVSKIEDKSTVSATEIKQFFKGFTKYDENSYNNPYKKPEAKFYESEPYKGFPAVVPFDTTKGWYAATKQTVAAFGNLAAFDDSGRISSFWLCNVGKNGLEEFNTGFGDDNCQQINIGTNQPYGQVLGLSDTEASRLISRAISALENAANQRQSNSNTKNILIEGKTIAVGEPAVNIPQMQCQDFMSPKDCLLMFNVCDPVICPSSRCNLGGNYNVPNVIQSGIIGSIALCLPNAKEGIAVPVCLSGVHAGIQGLESIYKNYNDCLKESLETGRQTGICDEIHSIYLCDFLWRQATPIAKVGIPKLLGGILGEGTRGGGEYLQAKSAWEGASNSVDYFTQSYAINSYNAFKVRSTDEVGTAVCKNFISARYPDVIDSLIEPDSPVQYYAWFDEIPYTTATIPSTSQYKVFYHIFAGKDIGSYYAVYLKSAPGVSFYETPGRFVVASGFIPRGGYASDTIDFTQASGYKELCISVNAQEECGFQKVSTSFALDYLKDKYLEEQASVTGVTSESECVSGSPSLYSLATPNLEEGVNEAINPQLYNYGIVRICSTNNPGHNSDPKTSTDVSRWKVVGNCDGSIGKVKCWVDTKSIKENIDIKYLENNTLDKISQNYIDYLNGEQGLLDEGETQSLIEEIQSKEKVLTEQEKIQKIIANLNNVIFSYQKAQLLLLRGDAYGNIALSNYIKIKAELEKLDLEEKLETKTKEGNENKDIIPEDKSKTTEEKQWTYDEAVSYIQKLKDPSEKYSKHKDFVDQIYKNDLITKEQYNDINGANIIGFKVGEESMNKVLDYLNEKHIQDLLEEKTTEEREGTILA